MGLNKDEKELLRLAKKTAARFGKKGNFLTGLIGELSACDKFNLKWGPSEGYDARDSKKKRFEVKTRRAADGGIISSHGTIGRFGRKKGYSFEYGLYVELGKNYEPVCFRRASKNVIRSCEKNVKKKLLTVSEIRQISEPY